MSVCQIQQKEISNSMMQNQFRCFALHKINISDDKNIGVFAKHLIVDVTPKTINQIYCEFFGLVLV